MTNHIDPTPDPTIRDRLLEHARRRDTVSIAYVNHGGAPCLVVGVVVAVEDARAAVSVGPGLIVVVSASDRVISVVLVGAGDAHE
jgi:hypothetical protein